MTIKDMARLGFLACREPSWQPAQGRDRHRVSRWCRPHPHRRV